jgi:hypothetical protein
MHIETVDVRTEQQGRDTVSGFVQQNLDSACAQVRPEEGDTYTGKRSKRHATYPTPNGGDQRLAERSFKMTGLFASPLDRFVSDDF